MPELIELNGKRKRVSRVTRAADVAEDDWTPRDEDAPDAPPNAFRRADHVELAQRLLGALHSPGGIVYDEGELYRFEPDTGLFAAVADERKSKTLQAFAGMPVGGTRKPLKLRLSDIRGAIALAHDQAGQPGFFATAADGVAFSNAFVRVTGSGIEAMDQSPTHRARSRYPFAFSRSPRTPRWIAFLQSVFGGDADAAEKVALLQEYAGACVLGIATRYQRALVLIGTGANGKSVLTRVLEAAMPQGSTAAIAPQSWGHEYPRALLCNKRLNVVAELPEGDILDSEAFKAITSGDPILGRHVRERPFTFRPIAGHIFAANRLPGAIDSTHGFWRRLIVVEFNRRFAAHEQREGLAEEIVATELPGVTAWLLEGAQRLLARGRFELPASSEQCLAEWRRTANPVALFLEERTDPLNDGLPITAGVQANTLYAAFRRWCEEAGHRPMARNKFGRTLTRDMELQGAKTSGVVHYALVLR